MGMNYPVQSADDKPAANEKEARQTSVNNLKQLALAMHNYHDKMALPKLGGVFKTGFHIAHGDGSASFINRKKIKEATLRAAITPASGDLLGNDWVEAIEY